MQTARTSPAVFGVLPSAPESGRPAPAQPARPLGIVSRVINGFERAARTAFGPSAEARSRLDDAAFILEMRERSWIGLSPSPEDAARLRHLEAGLWAELGREQKSPSHLSHVAVDSLIHDIVQARRLLGAPLSATEVTALKRAAWTEVVQAQLAAYEAARGQQGKGRQNAEAVFSVLAVADYVGVALPDEVMRRAAELYVERHTPSFIVRPRASEATLRRMAVQAAAAYGNDPERAFAAFQRSDRVQRFVEPAVAALRFAEGAARQNNVHLVAAGRDALARYQQIASQAALAGVDVIAEAGQAARRLEAPATIAQLLDEVARRQGLQ